MSRKGKSVNFKGQVLKRSNNSFRRREANGRKKFSDELQDHLAQKALLKNKRKQAYKASKEKDGSSFVRKAWNAVRGFLDAVSTFFQQL